MALDAGGMRVEGQKDVRGYFYWGLPSNPVLGMKGEWGNLSDLGT